ncbi:amino acid ABC transporter substrate-binding protein [Methylobacterium sp. NEAU 140]|uniref:amino acid ABC transporter substrate-binding protein n=1 Tax=Methylobacterium sp. NEAU 140 TaxID=3064945 RepID=UPI002736D0C9|nr:amino acid ABC transporter substrate-binding protein [Methylobacterium sp. NEAU 140]MDP4023672.1 amino acid ABC transporter substrate-binding protein [Methylobacterium sp. NEAU 140]
MRILGAMLLAAMVISPATADELTGTLKKIKDNNKIVLGVRDAAPPFSYLNDSEKYVGYTIDICGKIVDALKKDLSLPNLNVQMLSVNSSTRIPLMTNGTIDLECGSTTNNVERERQVAFTNSHFVTASKFASKKSSHIKTIDDLKDKNVTSIAGTTNIVQLIKVNTERKLGITVQPARDAADAFLLLETDRAAAYVMDDVQLSVAIATSKDPSTYVISEEAFSPPEPYGIMLRRNDAPFKTFVDRVTAELFPSPEMVKIYNKWFQSPVPPRGINYHYPMSAALKKALAHPTSSPDPAAYQP